MTPNPQERIIPADRFRSVLNELEAVASQYLEAELRAIQNGDGLTLEQQDKLDTYIAEEQQADGFLTAAHLIANETDATLARRIGRNATALRSFLAS